MSIEVRNLSKQYGKKQALTNVELTFEDGGLYGLFGRNGAGKSTMLKIIAGHIFPSSGEVLMNGQEMDRSKIYLMSENMLYPPKMRVRDAIRWSKEFYPDFDEETSNRLIEAFALSTKQKIDSLSTGYTSVFKLIIALSCGAPYIFLDEPVLGLDAGFRDIFYRELLRCYMRYQPMIVVSTHLIDEIADIIETVIIIKKGVIIQNTTCEELLKEGYTLSGAEQMVKDYLQGLPADEKVLGTERLGGLMSAYIMGKNRPESVPQGLELAPMNLQKLFIQLTEEGERNYVEESL